MRQPEEAPQTQDAAAQMPETLRSAAEGGAEEAPAGPVHFAGGRLRCGLLGEKLGHSLSPQIHALLGDYEYRLYEKRPNEVEAFVRNGAWDALNVTIPYKKTVMPLCAELSESAAEAGSVNTLVRRPDGTVFGDNTDVYGFETLLDTADMKVRDRKVLVLGSGGASAAVCAVLRWRGARITVISRHGENDYRSLDRHADADFVVNTTPVGMFPNTEESPVDLRLFPQLSGVADIIYNPPETCLLSQAASLGVPCIGGLTMLAAQAVAASARFTGTAPQTEKIPAILAQLSPLRILVINGPNLNLLGLREPEIYGRGSYADLVAFIGKTAREEGVAVECFQSNHEGAIVDAIQEAVGQYDGIVINPAAYTHTSVAILDALKAVRIPAVEVHLSDVSAREDFRQISYAGKACAAAFTGLGFEGYACAIRYLKTHVRKGGKTV